MFYRQIIYLSLTGLIIGCAGSNISQDIDSDIEKSFKIDEAKLEKFKVKKKVEVKPEPRVDNRSKEENVEKPREKSSQKVTSQSKKASKPNQINLKVKSTDTKNDSNNQELTKLRDQKKEVPKKLKRPEDNLDYPKTFRKYNQKYKKYWDDFSPVFYPGEMFKYEISWSIFKAGTATIETLNGLQLGNKDVYSIKATMESADYFENIYKLKNSLVTYIEKESFFPMKYELKQRESSQSVDDLQLFDEEELKTNFYYKRIKEGKTKIKNEEKYIPRYFTDSFSALYFVRGMPLKVGLKFGFPMVTRTKVWLLKAEVESIENIDVLGKKVEAYKIKAVTQFPGVLKKRGDINFWYSADEQRRLLRFEAKIKIGSVKGELIEFRPGVKN